MWAMVIGICRLTFVLHDNHSLKGKRHVLKPMMEKVKSRFNVSVAEVGDNDLWLRAEVGISVVGNDRAYANSVLDNVIEFIDGLHMAELTAHSIEIINC